MFCIHYYPHFSMSISTLILIKHIVVLIHQRLRLNDLICQQLRLFNQFSELILAVDLHVWIFELLRFTQLDRKQLPSRCLSFIVAPNQIHSPPTEKFASRSPSFSLAPSSFPLHTNALSLPRSLLHTLRWRREGNKLFSQSSLIDLYSHLSMTNDFTMADS